jgi:membrane protease YdiL (CAAX protease family)
MSEAETAGWLRRLRGIAEPLLAMVGALGVTVLLTVPFIPQQQQLEVPLRPQVGAEALPHAELEERTLALGVADEAQVMLIEGASRLVLTGVPDGTRAEWLVAELLGEAGYQRDEFRQTLAPDFDALLTPDPRGLPLVMSIQTVVFTLAGLLLGRGRAGGPLRAPPRSIPIASLIGVGAGIAAVVASAAIAWVLELLGFPVEEQAWLVELFQDRETLWRLSPFIVLIVPLSEEIFFRFYVFRFVAHHTTVGTGLFASSLLFAMVHANPSGFLVYLAIGAVLAWSYRYTGRMVSPIVGHATLNSIVLIGSQIAPPGGGI